MSPALVVVENILQAIATSIQLGAVYGLLCVGLGLIFSIMRVINFAQGEFMMLGMYAALFAFTTLGLGGALGTSTGLVASALLAGVALFLLAAVLHPALLARVTGSRVSGTEGEGHYPQLVLTLGISLVLANGGLLVFGSSPHTIQTELSASAWGVPLGEQMMLFLNKARSLSLLVSLAVVLVVTAFITRTRTGKTLRAAADNPVAATYMGIDVTRLRLRIHSSLTSAASSSSSCTRAWCLAAWAASRAHSGAAS
jgi:branched-chain amino acid transport system permease protein